MRNYLKLLGLGLLGISVFAAWQWWVRVAEAEPVRYSTATAQNGVVTSRITASGSLSANVTVQVGAQVSGRIQSLHADFNSVVKKGQVIAQLDSQLFEAVVEQARANLIAAEGNLKRERALALNAQRQAQRAHELFGKGLFSEAERDTVTANAEAQQAAIAAAEGVVAQARAALNQAKINLGYTVISSPINGTVISRNMDVGQTVAASMSAPVIFVVAEDLRQMQLHTAVPESDVASLKPDMPIVFGVDAYPREQFTGRLMQVRNAPHLEQNVVTYDAVIEVDNTDLRLKPGMTANVSFILAQSPQSLVVPNAALSFRPAGAAAASGSGARNSEVWVLRAVLPEKVPVEAGISDGSRTAVSSPSLQAGDQVITDIVAAKTDAALQIGRF